MRNGLKAAADIPAFLRAHGRPPAGLMVYWSPDRLAVSLAGPIPPTIVAQNTPVTQAPLGLVKWARAQMFVPEATYRTAKHVFEAAVIGLQNLNEKLNRTSGFHAFWDGDRPKRESPGAQGVLDAFLSELTIYKNLDIVREPILGSGRLDFLVIGSLSDGSRVRGCLEVKAFYSDRIEHGLLRQLPEYMKRVDAEFGIYCVLDYGSGHRHASTTDAGDPADQLMAQAMDRGLENVRVVTVTVHKHESPSKV